MKKQPVLIVVEGGIADVRYCPPGVVVVTKDYDTEGVRPWNLRKDPADGIHTPDEFGLAIATHRHAHGKQALAEGLRIMKEEKIR